MTKNVKIWSELNNLFKVNQYKILENIYNDLK